MTCMLGNYFPYNLQVDVAFVTAFSLNAYGNYLVAAK